MKHAKILYNFLLTQKKANPSLDWGRYLSQNLTVYLINYFSKDKEKPYPEDVIPNVDPSKTISVYSCCLDKQYKTNLRW